jgi:hypothetical protein
MELVEWRGPIENGEPDQRQRAPRVDRHGGFESRCGFIGDEASGDPSGTPGGCGSLEGGADLFELRGDQSLSRLDERQPTESIADRRLQDDARIVHRALGDREPRPVMVSWGYRSFAGTGGLGGLG